MDYYLITTIIGITMFVQIILNSYLNKLLIDISPYYKKEIFVGFIPIIGTIILLLLLYKEYKFNIKNKK